MIYQLAAIDATHLHIIYRIKRRIEMTDIIYHLYQIIHIDDELLIDLHKLIAQIEQGFALDISLQTNDPLVPGNNHLPTALFMIILKESDVALVYQFEIQGVGIKQKLRILLAAITLIRMKHEDVFMGETVHDSSQILLIDWLEQHIKSLLAKSWQDILIIRSQGGRIKMRSPPKVLTGNFRPSQLSSFLS